MESTRLRSVVDAVVADNGRHEVINLLEALENAYTQSVQSPNAPQAEAFDKALTELTTAVSSGRCAQLSPSRRKILDRVGGTELCGDGLASRVQELFDSARTPASAVETMQKLRSQVEEFVKTCQSVKQAFERFKIEPDEPPADAAEVEIAIPSRLVDESLGPLAKETTKLDRAIADIMESVTGNRGPVKISGLGSGSVEIFVTVDPVTGAAVLTFVTAIVQLINSLLQNRKVRTDLEQRDAPRDIVQQLKAWDEKQIKDGLDRLVTDFMKTAKGDRKRKAELRNALAKSLEYLADRIDRGLDVDVVTQPPPAADPQDGAPDVEQDPATAARAQIAERGGVIRKLERGPEPVLMLTAGEEGDAEQDPSQNDEDDEK